MAKSLLIVWHSRTGGAEAMACAAADAARDAGAEGQGDGSDPCQIVLRRANEATADDVLAADGYLFVCPENLAAISGEMKEFFDRSYYAVLGRIEGRPYAVMVCAGSDGENALRQIDRIATGWRLKKIADGLIICTHAQTGEAILAEKTIGESDLEACRERGAALAAGLSLGVF